MEQPNRIKDYLDSVLKQVRYVRVHQTLSSELGNHILDQKEAYEAQGANEEEALVKAIREMGDPIEVGTRLDRTHRPRPQWSMIVLTVILLAAGLFIRFFTSRLATNGVEYYYRQLMFTLVGMVLMIAVYKVDFTIIAKVPKTIFLSLAALTIGIILVTNPVYGRYAYGIYPLLLFPTAFAGLIYSMRNKGYQGVILCGIGFLVPLFLAFFIPSISSAFLLSLSCLILLTVAITQGLFNVRKLFALLLVYIPTLIAGCITLILAWRRLSLVFMPQLDSMGAGYMELLVRRILKESVWIGQGGAASPSDRPLLPGINEDFLLTYIIHRFGWIAFVIVSLLFIVFIVRALILCARQRSVLARLVSLSVILVMALQVVFYSAVNLGFHMFSPLSLPFISQGSSFLLVNMCLVGILLSVFRTGHFMKDESGGRKIPQKSFITYEDGRLTIDFKVH